MPTFLGDINPIVTDEESEQGVFWKVVVKKKIKFLNTSWIMLIEFYIISWKILVDKRLWNFQKFSFQ